MLSIFFIVMKFFVLCSLVMKFSRFKMSPKGFESTLSSFVPLPSKSVAQFFLFSQFKILLLAESNSIAEFAVLLS